MSWSQDNGYIPSTVPDLMNLVMAGLNASMGWSYTTESFAGTSAYKYYYAAVQRLVENEVKTSEIVAKIQNYFKVTNESITRPNTTAPGIVDYFFDRGYQVSVKPPLDADAGKAFICVNTDGAAPDYATTKAKLCKIVSECVVGGVISQGTESLSIELSNGQAFDFKYYLPDKQRTYLRLTITPSNGNLASPLTTAQIKDLLLSNINARYKMGLDFEPQRYFSIVDAPWAATVLLEYSDDNATWTSAVFNSAFDDLFTFDLADISVV